MAAQAFVLGSRNRAAGAMAVLERHRRAFLAHVDRFLDAEAERYSQAWGKRLAQSTAVGLLTTVVLHFAIVATLPHRGPLRTVVLATILVAGLVLSVTLVVLYWSARYRPGSRHYALAALAGALTAAVAIEAFSAGHLLLWRAHAVSGDGHPSLWHVERLYGWHLLNSVPLLSVPSTLGIEKPRLFGDHLSGGMVLAFKLVVLVPLIGLVISCYRFAEQQVGKSRAALDRRQKADDRDAAAREDLYAVAIIMAFGAAATALTVWLALAPRSPLLGLVPAKATIPADWIPDQLTAGDVTLPAHPVVSVFLPLAGVLLLGRGVVFAFDPLADYLPYLPRTGTSPFGWVAAILATLTLITAALLGVLTLLVSLGVSVPAGHAPDGAAPGVGLAFLLWHVLDGIPGLDIPHTLNWELAHDLDDTASGAVLLTYKAALVFAAIFITSRVLQPWLRSRAAGAEGALAAATEFAALAERAATHMDTAPPGDLRSKALVLDVDRSSTDVHALFGSGAVAAAADEVAERLDARFRGALTPRGPRADRASFDAALEAYRAAAQRALRTAADPG